MRLDAATRIIYHNPAIQAARVMATYGGAGTWWDDNGTISGCVGAWAAKGAASLAASYTDLSGNGNDLTEGTAPTWSSANGWGNTSSENWYLDTGVVISSSTTWSFIVRYSNAASGSGNLMGIYGGAASLRLQFDAWSGANQIGYGNGNLTNLGSATSGDHTVAIASTTAYQNGSSVGSISTGGSHSNNAYIGALNVSDSPDFYLAIGYVKAVAFYNVTLSGPDVATISTAMAAL